MPRPAALALALAVCLAGCASFEPQPLAEVPFLDRARTRVVDGLSVTVAVPTTDEARAIYGVSLDSKGIQPVWLEVVNPGPGTWWFLPTGLDPQFFSPREAAYAFHGGSPGRAAEIDAHFRRLAFQNPVRPGATVSGFVLVNLDEGYKAVSIDLIRRGASHAFTFVFVDPGFEVRDKYLDLDTLWTPGSVLEIDDEAELRTALAALPPCVTDRDGDEPGDPLNVVLVGHRHDIFAALVRRGWHATELISLGTVWRTIGSFFTGSRYRTSPMSPLFVYGRPQDFSAQKARGSINERNHMRFWLTPIRYRGQDVWIGQISRDIGVKFTFASPTISTHKIDPDVDEARRYLLEDLAYSQALHTVAFVEGVGWTTEDEPRFNLTEDPWYSDGLRVVMFFGDRPATLADLRFLDWGTPGVRRQAGEGDR